MCSLQKTCCIFHTEQNLSHLLGQYPLLREKRRKQPLSLFLVQIQNHPMRSPASCRDQQSRSRIKSKVVRSEQPGNKIQLFENHKWRLVKNQLAHPVLIPDVEDLIVAAHPFNLFLRSRRLTPVYLCCRDTSWMLGSFWILKFVKMSWFQLPRSSRCCGHDSKLFLY